MAVNLLPVLFSKANKRKARVISCSSPGLSHPLLTCILYDRQLLPQTLSFLTYTSKLCEAKGDDECGSWLSELFDTQEELAAFVVSRQLEGGRDLHGICQGPVQPQLLP